jgi:tRNA pseudouridine55 synthase
MTVPGTVAPAAPSRPRGRRPARVHGVLALDKDVGMTSFAAVSAVRRILDERRVGHAGTLDPMAGGLLPICVGNATRLTDYFHEQRKRYHCTVRLGERSDTMDLEGAVVSTGDASAVDAATITAALQRFIGDIEQVPPMHSAVRHQGRHLYELAREGLEVERSARTVHIESIELLSLRPGAVAEAELDVVCGKGTYMRVLADELGSALGCGGVLAWLRRTEYGALTMAQSLTLDQLASLDHPASALLPLAVAVDFLPRVDLPPQLALQVRRGQAVWVPGRPGSQLAGRCRAHAATGELIALGELTGGLFRPEKVLSVEAG